MGDDQTSKENNIMTIKTILVDAGIDKTYITTVDVTKKIIKTHSIHNVGFNSQAKYIFDLFVSNAAEGLLVDRVGHGIVLIDALVGLFEENGFVYDYKDGIVQRESQRIESPSPGTFSGVLPAIPPVQTDLDERQKEVIEKYAKEIERLNKELENQQKLINHKVEIYDSLKSLRESYNKMIKAFEMK